jgi:hypothetical protein
MPPRGDRLRWPPRRSRRRPDTRQTLATDDERPAPRQPNERDESSDSQASAPRDVMRQAASDLERGLEDTDCRNEAGEIVRERQREGTK